MLPSTLFVRRLLLTALPSFALIAGACSDNDGADPASGGGNAGTAAGRSGASGATGKAGAAGSSSGATGKAGESGKAGETGSSGAAGAFGNAGSSGSDAEAGAGGEVPTGDQIAPTVLSSSPPKGATEVAIQSAILVTFSEAMNTTTLTSESIRVTSGGVAVPGQISYFQQTATFTPVSPLTPNSPYQIAVSIAATDLAGNALAQAYTSSFTTSALAALGPAPVKLGTAGNYAILAKSAISNVPTSVITGDLGLSPAAASYITGFTMTRAGMMWTSPEVVGGLFAADNDPTTPVDLTTAVADMHTAYEDAAGRPTPAFLNLGDGAIGGLTLARACTSGPPA